MNFYLLILVQVCLVDLTFSSTYDNWATGQAPKASWDDDPRYDLTWKEPQAKLDALVGGEVLEPNETLELLKILDEKYKIRGDEDSLGKHRRIKDLLSVSELDEGNCDQSIKLIGKLQGWNSAFPNVLAYLRHYEEAQYEICSEKLLGNLRKEVATLPGSIEQVLDRLKTSTIQANSQKSVKESLFKSDNDAIINGVVEFMKRELDPIPVEDPNVESVFKTKFDGLIKKPCETLVGKWPIKIAEFKILSQEKELVKRLDPLAIKWLENYYLCSSIYGSSDLIRDASMVSILNRDHRSENKQMGKKQANCLNCLGGLLVKE